MTADATSLRNELRQAGLTTGVIDAVWPEWWSEAAETSPSAGAELRYTIARRLGMSPRSLFDGPPRFVWRDRAKYKNLGAASTEEAGILSSYGVAVAQFLLQATPGGLDLPASASIIRTAILQSSPFVGLDSLLALCWGLGIPVVQVRLFPLPQKRMHAMSVQLDRRAAILLGFETRFPARSAFAIAHEIGHLALGHTGELPAILDIEDPVVDAVGADDEERAADRFALELLTGDPDVQVEANTNAFTAVQLADAAMRGALDYRVDPGVLALCLAHATRDWEKGFGALKLIPPGEVNVGELVNAIALRQLGFDSLPLDAQDYLGKVIGSVEVGA